MTALDAGVITIIAIFLFRGIWVGLIRQLASIAALVLGYIIAGRYYQESSSLISGLVPSPQLGFLLTYGLIFAGVFAVVIGLGYLLKKVVTISLLGWFDRMMGGLFGLSKAAIITTVCYMVLSGFLASSNPLLTKSVTAPYLDKSTDFMLTFVKDNKLHDNFLPKKPAISLPSLPIPGSKPGGGDTKKESQ